MEDEKNAPKKPDNTELAFKLYDKDKDGFITKSEMSKVSKRLSKEQVDKVMITITTNNNNNIESPTHQAFTKYDADGNGKLDYVRIIHIFIFIYFSRIKNFRHLKNLEY